MNNKEYEQKLILYILTHPCEDFPLEMSLGELNKKEYRNNHIIIKCIGKIHIRFFKIQSYRKDIIF